MHTHPPDDVLRALAEERQRSVIRYLANTADGVASHQELTEHLASQSSDPPPDVAIHLRHIALPVLEERGLLRHDPESELIHYHPDSFVEDVLDGMADA